MASGTPARDLGSSSTSMLIGISSSSVVSALDAPAGLLGSSCRSPLPKTNLSERIPRLTKFVNRSNVTIGSCPLSFNSVAVSFAVSARPASLCK